jgi:hypothetical protein
MEYFKNCSQREREQKRLLFRGKEEALGMLKRKKPLDNVNDLRREMITMHLLFHIQIEFKLLQGERTCSLRKNRVPLMNQRRKNTFRTGWNFINLWCRNAVSPLRHVLERNTVKCLYRIRTLSAIYGNFLPIYFNNIFGNYTNVGRLA